VGVRVPSSAQKQDKTLNSNGLGVFGFETDTKLTQENILTLNSLFEEFKKKMQLSENTGINLKYYPATLKTTSNRWRIEFYSFNPYSQKLERVVYRVDKIKKKFANLVVARRELNKHCEIINYKLMAGWTPFCDCSNIKEVVSIKDVALKFIDIKGSELREESLRSYRSYINVFIEWLTLSHKEKLISIDFTKYDAINYLDWITSTKKVSPNTWNNYRSFMITFFSWLIERGYYNKNIFADIQPKKKVKKKRIVIPSDERKRIFDYLEQNDMPFLIFLLLEFHCLMRPIEIFRMKIADINLDTQIIALEGSQTKNKYNRNITIPDVFIPIIKKFWNSNNIEKYNRDYYLFSKKLEPGNFLMRTKDAGSKWSKLREVLNLQEEYQLYSLRDTAITEMLLNNISAKVVQMHADHHDLTITSGYADHVTPEMRKEIKENSPKF